MLPGNQGGPGAHRPSRATAVCLCLLTSLLGTPACALRGGAPVVGSAASPSSTEPHDAPVRGVAGCPAGLPGPFPPQLQVQVGGGYLRDTALANLSQVVWVGPECLGVFTGSPAVVRLPGQSGDLLASHDYFGATTRGVLKQVFRSRDDGVTWELAGSVSDMYWSNLFVHRGDGYVYMIGTNGTDIHKTSPPNTTPMKGGPVVISRSKDGGATWCRPVTLFNGSYATGPTPIVAANGVLYRSMEGPDNPSKALVISAPETADLLDPASWKQSVGPGGENGIVIADAGPGPDGARFSSWQEGSAVEGPDGRIVNLLRVNGQTARVANVAAYTVLDNVTNTLSFVKWVRGPFSESKFVVRRDPTSATPLYFAVSTNITKAMLLINPRARNNLVFSTSTNLEDWRVCATVLRDDSGLALPDSAKYTGFEYPDWQFDGDDIFVGVRTAYRGAVSSGSSNRMTFAWIRGYRSRCGL